MVACLKRGSSVIAGRRCFHCKRTRENYNKSCPNCGGVELEELPLPPPHPKPRTVVDGTNSSGPR